MARTQDKATGESQDTELAPAKEKFARLIAEGLNQADAYRECVKVRPTTKQESVWQRASQWANEIKVQSRVLELQREAAQSTGVTIEECTEELREAIDMAREQKNVQAFTGAVMAKAKLNGLVVDKKEVTSKRDKTELTDDELEKILAGHLSAVDRGSRTGASRPAESASQSSRVH